MVKFGKWLGGGLGWALGGPLGALIGFAVGSVFDSAEISVSRNTIGENIGYNPQTAAGDFAASLLALSAAVMKSDGKVLRSELDYVKRFLVVQFGETNAQKLLPVLKDLLARDIPVAEICKQIRLYMPEAQRLQLLQYLFGIAQADGHVDEREEKLIASIATNLGVSQTEYESIRAVYWRDTESDYKILEILPTASDEEVKKAHRKMVMKYHPDRVTDLGEAAQKAAHEQFQHIQEAYENIRKTRGFA
jgi:DnaJ like chaperone protein